MRKTLKQMLNLILKIMKVVLSILIICFLFLNLFFIVNWFVFKYLKPENTFRKMWVNHVCDEAKWENEETP